GLRGAVQCAARVVTLCCIRRVIDYTEYNDENELRLPEYKKLVKRRGIGLNKPPCSGEDAGSTGAKPALLAGRRVMLNDFNGTCHSRPFRQAIRRCILDQA